MNLFKKNNPPNSFCQEKVGSRPFLCGFDCWLIRIVNDIVLNSIKILALLNQEAKQIILAHLNTSQPSAHDGG